MVKKEKYFFIDSIQNLDLDYIKKTKASLIIRKNIKENHELVKFANKCKNKMITIFIANNIKLLFKLKLNNFYISSYNQQNYNYLKRISSNINIIGSAHSLKEILMKKKQGCDKIVFSRLFETYKKGYYNIVKFNLITRNTNYKYIALGGIKKTNIRKLNIVNCSGIAILSDVKNKPLYLL